MDNIIKDCDNTAEELMRKGMWNEAKNQYIDCRVLEASELTLRVANLEWRRDCAQYISRTLDEPVPVDAFVQDITARYDSFVAEWIVRYYRGISIVLGIETYMVTRRD